MSETYPIDLKGINKVITTDTAGTVGIIAWLLSFPGAIYSVIWSICWWVQDGRGAGPVGSQADWNMDPHLFVLLGIVLLAQTILPWFYHKVNKLLLREGSNGEIMTKVYNQLSPINKELAKPLVQKVYELERSGVWNEEVRKAHAARIKLIKQIQTQQENDFHNNLVIDNSDLDAVEYVLQHKKEIASI